MFDQSIELHEGCRGKLVSIEVYWTFVFIKYSDIELRIVDVNRHEQFL